jgi:hypothetical protein
MKIERWTRTSDMEHALSVGTKVDRRTKPADKIETMLDSSE